MSADRHYDVIIIGTGAGGGTLAYRLAPSGKKILLLERGPYLARERDNWDTVEVFVKGKYRAPETWRDADDKEFAPGINYYVGGNTKFYGAALFRLRPQDFGELAHYGGVSPAWPISYDDLEPYYTAAEQLWQVHGHHGEDPSEGRASAEYPRPPIAHEPRIQRLSDDLTKLGLHPFHLPIGNLLDEREGGGPTRESVCIKCDRFDGFPCPLNGKSDAETICVGPAVKHANVEILTEAFVDRLDTDATGHTVTGVQVRRGDAHETYSADIVVVAAGALNSALLLLHSANDKHSAGLGNSSDAVGRFYMCHNNEALMAVSKEPNPTRFQKTLAMNDWYLGADDSELPLGGIQMVGKSDGEMIRGEAPHWAHLLTRMAPEASLDDTARHAIDFWLCSEDLPQPGNRITVDGAGKVTLTRSEKNNMEAHERLTKKLESMLDKLGMHPHLLKRRLYLGKEMDIAAVAHQAGTVRFGSDPKTSVLDADCKAHDLDNLYVVDTSFMPTIGAVNPSLTAMANALRVGDHLLERLDAKADTGPKS
jgi:choline dehydrogenase-like flavoprotein